MEEQLIHVSIYNYIYTYTYNYTYAYTYTYWKFKKGFLYFPCPPSNIYKCDTIRSMPVILVPCRVACLPVYFQPSLVCLLVSHGGLRHWLFGVV